MKSVEISVSGEVQNKGLRFCSMYAANTLGLKGYVRYNNNNEVFIAAEGEEDRLDQFIGWCRNGLLSSSFSDIGIKETTVKGYQSFDIVHDNDPNGLFGPHFSILNRSIKLILMIFHFFISYKKPPNRKN